MPSDWVSVKDRLPEKDGEYLTLHDDGRILVNLLSQKEYWAVYSITYPKNDPSKGIMQHAVTHWMPLPEKPEE